MNQGQGLTIGPDVNIAILKFPLRKRQDSDSFNHGPQSRSMWRRSRMNFQFSTRKKVNVRQGLSQRRCHKPLWSDKLKGIRKFALGVVRQHRVLFR